MATLVAIGQRRAKALARIEARCAALRGSGTLTLPRQSRFGPDMLLVLQLEALADYLDAVELPVPDEYAQMSAAQIRERLAAHNVRFDKRASKSLLLDILKAAEQAAGETTNASAL